MSRGGLRAVVVSLLLTLASLLGATTTSAQNEPAGSPANVEAARKLAKEGLAAVKDERFEDAIPILNRSLELHRAPFTLYTLGLAYQGADQPAAALESFRQFLALPSSRAMQRYEAPAKKAVKKLEDLVAYVTITVTPDDADDIELTIDGDAVPAAALGMPRLIDPGDHVIEVVAKGHKPAREEVSLSAKDSIDVELTLRRLPKKKEAPVAPRDDVDTEGEGTGALVTQVVFIALGTAALGAGITVGMLGVSQAEDAAFNDDADAEEAKTKSLIGDVLAISGGALAGVGLIWLIVDLATDGEDANVPSAIAPWSDGTVVGAELRF